MRLQALVGKTLVGKITENRGILYVSCPVSWIDSVTVDNN